MEFWDIGEGKEEAWSGGIICFVEKIGFFGYLECVVSLGYKIVFEMEDKPDVPEEKPQQKS